MNTYHFTSDTFTGHVIFVFNEKELLLQYDVTNAQLSDGQMTWITERLPKTLNQLKDVLKKSKGAQLTIQQKTEITFLEFWNRYDEKTRSSKKKAERIWNRMPQTQRDRAYNFIPMYNRSIPTGIAKKYTETYLNAELWNN